MILCTVGEVLERHAMVSSGTDALQMLKKIDKPRSRSVTVTVRVNLEPGVPEGLREGFERWYIDHPDTHMTVKVARRAHLRESREDGAIDH